jgi:hypothetical protein
MNANGIKRTEISISFFKWIVLVGMFLVVSVNLMGEKIPYNDGAGWDGLLYREIAASFSSQIQDEGYNQYSLQRLLPFALLHYSFLALGIPLSNDSLMQGILVFNFIALLLGLFWYFQLARQLQFSEKLQILGLILLFVNFPVLKVTWYEPFVTDLFAFVIGIGQLNFFVRKKKLVLFTLSLVSGFVWPTALLVGLLLLFLPASEPVRKAAVGNKWLWLIPILASAVLVFGFFNWSERPEKPLTELIRHLLSLSAVMLVFYGIWISLRLDLKRNIKVFFRNWRLQDVIFFLGSLVLFYSSISWMANGQDSFGLKAFLMSLLIRPIQLPFNFLANHFLYFGMLVPLGIFYFRSILQCPTVWDFRYLAVLIALLVLGLNSESRMIINLIPFLLLPVLQVLQHFEIKWKHILILFGINLLLSKFWYSINVPGIAEALETYSTAVYLEFPAQRYFQHFGPWQHFDMYLLYLIGLFVALLLIRRYYRYSISAF